MDSEEVRKFCGNPEDRSWNRIEEKTRLLIIRAAKQCVKNGGYGGGDNNDDCLDCAHEILRFSRTHMPSSTEIEGIHEVIGPVLSALNKRDCMDLSILRNVKSYTVKVMAVQACLEKKVTAKPSAPLRGVPLKASVRIWDSIVRSAKVTWKETNHLPLAERLGMLLSNLQTESRYRFKSGSENFLVHLYQEGTLNCRGNTSLLIALGEYLGYSDRIYNLLSESHNWLALREGNKWVWIETTLLGRGKVIDPSSKSPQYHTTRMFRGDLMNALFYYGQFTAFPVSPVNPYRLFLFDRIFPRTELTTFLRTAYYADDTFYETLMRGGYPGEGTQVDGLIYSYLYVYDISFLLIQKKIVLDRLFAFYLRKMKEVIRL